MRQLQWMVDAKGNFEWQQTSCLEALQVNMNLKKGAKAVSPDDLNPFAKKSSKKCDIDGKEAWDAFKNVIKQRYGTGKRKDQCQVKAQS